MKIAKRLKNHVAYQFMKIQLFRVLCPKILRQGAVPFSGDKWNMIHGNNRGKARCRKIFLDTLHIPDGEDDRVHDDDDWGN